MEAGLPGKNNFFLIIQARLNSKRLPGKILFNFFNKTVFERIIEISTSAVEKKKVVVLLGDKKESEILSHICKKKDISYFYSESGKEDNVYKRFKDFLIKNKCSFFIRLTSDNYLIQPFIIKKMINFFSKNNFDYSYVAPLSHFAVEIVRSKVFLDYKRITKKGKEHLTWDIRKDKRIKKKIFPKNYMGIDHSKKIAIDNLSDLILMKKLETNYNKLRNINCLEIIKKIQKKF